MENESSSECIAMSNECIICLLNYTEETKKITECIHIFHQECLERWLQENTSCPLCRTELKPKNNVYRPIYALPSEHRPSGRYNSSRLSPVTLNLADSAIFGRIAHSPVVAVMTTPGYNQEDDSILLRLSRETLRDMQPQQESGVTLNFALDAPEMRQYQRMMLDFLGQSHREIRPSGSIGITHVAPPVRLDVTDEDDDLIPQPLEEELTQEVMDTLFGGRSRMQNTGEILDMAHRGLVGEDDEEDEYTRMYGTHIRANFD